MFECLVAGLGIGAFFFFSLRWSVARGLASRQPALWFLGSLWVRMSFAIAGFWLVSQGDFRRVVVCLLGFWLARAGVLRAT